MKPYKKILLCIVLSVLSTVAVLGIMGWRMVRMGSVGLDAMANLRYQINSGESVAETPASEALAIGYLEGIFGDNQELLGKLKGVVTRGVKQDESLRLGEVSAMLVTYNRTEDAQVENVIAHVLGGFPLGKRKPGFHRDGYFRHLIDKNIWNLGNSFISLFGRDMVIFAEEDTAVKHQAVLEALFASGNVLPLAEEVRDKLYYTAVLPDPKRLLPLQIRPHVQAIIIKGYLSPEGGVTELVLLTPSSKSAQYALSVLSDMQTVGEVALKTKWKGVEYPQPWGAVWIDTWWAYHMVEASENTVFDRQHNIIRIKSRYDRVVVNAILKSIERMGRDLAQIKGSLEDRRDPRLVDESLRSVKPQHYWSEEHRWGPDWPFGSTDTNFFANANAASPPNTVQAANEATAITP